MWLKVFIHIILIYNDYTYKPVVLLHGINSGNESMSFVKGEIIKKHPGTIIYNIESFSGLLSYHKMWYQVQQVGHAIMNISAQHPDGVNFLGHSQGALIGRAILQVFPEHKVHNFISLSGPQAGQYGIAFLDIICPGIAASAAFKVLYTRVGQYISIGNYWNDPFHQKLYLKFSRFLPYVNNDIVTNKSAQYKEGLVRLNKLVLIGGPDDDLITPWESSQFGYYDDKKAVKNLMKRDIFTKDLIGLQTLYNKDKLDIITVPGVKHHMWNLNMLIFDNCILKYLD